MRVELTELAKRYPSPQGGGEVRALDGVSLTLEPGSFTAVQGPSGCGKSTLLLIAGGLLRPDAGLVRLDGTDPYALSPERRSRFRAQHIGFVFQQFHLVPYLTVRQNVLAAATASGMPHHDAKARADELLHQFAIAPRAHHHPAALSTGERQRTALARALLNRPGLILADEPTGNLDGENASEVLTALARFAADGGTVLLVTHDARAADAASHAVRLRAGRLDPDPARLPDPVPCDTVTA